MARRASATRSCRRPTRPLSDRHAVDIWLEHVRARPGEVTLVTCGPLTNLARALEREPELPRLLRRWVAHGRRLSRPRQHRADDRVEHPLRPGGGEDRVRRRRSAGPAASAALGLDVTEKAKILPDHIVELARRAGSTPDDSIALARGEDPMHATLSVASNPIVRFIADALRFYMEFHSRYDGFYGAFIHDPLAMAAALDPSLVRTEALAVDVELDGTLTAGETVTDWRRVWGRPPNVDVAVEADAEEFLRRFVERVGGLAAEPVERGTLSAEGSRPAAACAGGRSAGRARDDGRARAGCRSAPRARPMAASRRSSSSISSPSSSASSSSRSSRVRSRDLSTPTLALMPVSIAINIAVGSIIVALRLPIYLDSIGTVLVGALAGPWAGALTGLLANLIWSILPVPGGAGPTIAFFAPVAAVIGLMAGFWAGRGVFQHACRRYPGRRIPRARDGHRRPPGSACSWSS